RDRLVANAVEKDRDDQPEADSEQRGEDEPEEAVPERGQRVREREEVDVVVQPDPSRVAVVAEAQDDSAKERVDHEDGGEADRRESPEVGPDPHLNTFWETLDDPLSQVDIAEQDERNADHG